MTDVPTRIKNLSIALEALSRIPNSGHLSKRIEATLEEEIDTLEKEQTEKAYPPARPAIPTPDDDILF